MNAWIDGWFGALGPGMRSVLTVSWQASVLVVIVLAVQAVFGRWLSARWRYALWSVVVLRLLLPVTPGSAVSVFNLFRGDPGAGSEVIVAELPAGSGAEPMGAVDLSGFEPVAYAAGGESAEPINPWSLAEVVLVVWLVGASLVLGVLLLINIMLALRLRRCVELNDPGVLELVEACKREMGVKRVVRLIILPGAGVTSPALAGVFRPTLLIPPELIDELSREELRFVLLHELAHVKKHDIAMNWLLIALSALHWFNPLVWFAFSRLRADRELARDAMVLRATGTDASQAYGQTIIHILERLTRPRLSNPALAGIGDGMGQLKRRLRMIALSPKRRPALTVVGAVLLATLAVIGLTDAAERGANTTTIEPENPPITLLEDARVSANFNSAHLESIINFIKAHTSQPVFIDWEALEPTGVDRNELITISFEPLPIEQALWLVLRSASDGEGDGAPAIVTVDGVLTVSTVLVSRRLTDPNSAHPHDDGGTSGWRSRFDAVYRLNEGEVVKRIAPPFIPERTRFYHLHAHTTLPGTKPPPPDVYHFRWNSKLEVQGMMFGADMSIERLLNYVLDLYTYEYEGDRALLGLRIPGDWIYDFDAEGGAKRDALARVIEEATGKKLRFTLTPMERDVIVAAGRWDPATLAVGQGDGLIHVYSGDRFDPDEQQGVINGDLDEFFRRTAWELGVRIEDRVTERPEGWSLAWKWYSSSRLHTQDVTDEQRSVALRSLLDNLEKQTGLTFTVEKRVEDVWVVGEVED